MLTCNANDPPKTLLLRFLCSVTVVGRGQLIADEGGALLEAGGAAKQDAVAMEKKSNP